MVASGNIQIQNRPDSNPIPENTIRKDSFLGALHHLPEQFLGKYFQSLDSVSNE